MLINTQELYDIISGGKDNGKNIIIIDARSFGEYAKGHIPGAVNLDLFAFHWNDTSLQGIADFQKQTARLLSFAGVTRDTPVVIYDDQSGMLAARGVWMLFYMSCNHTRMLDGGFSKWRAESRAIETATVAYTPAESEFRPDPSIIADYQYIADNLERLVIVDARSPLEYDGSVIRAARPGHIPNAINIEWKQNLADDDGQFKSNEDLAELYKEIPRNSEIVTYCQGAYRAANSFLALKKAGFENAKVYLGSWGEWGNLLKLPVAVKS